MESQKTARLTDDDFAHVPGTWHGAAEKLEYLRGCAPEPPHRRCSTATVGILRVESPDKWMGVKPSSMTGATRRVGRARTGE